MGAQGKFGGVSQYFLPDGRMVERGTKKCNHCQRPVEVDDLRKLMEVMDLCRGCMKLICLPCYGETWQKGCMHHLKAIEVAEEKAQRDIAFARSMGFYK